MEHNALVHNAFVQAQVLRDSSIGIPDDAVEEGGFYYWIETESSPPRVLCAGAPGGPFEVHNGEFPDEIRIRLQQATS
jgi:hypothetical protein